MLRGAIPILLNQNAGLPADLRDQGAAGAPIGSKILSVARAYEALTHGHAESALGPSEAIRELRADTAAAYDLEVLDALERSVGDERQLMIGV